MKKKLTIIGMAMFVFIALSYTIGILAYARYQKQLSESVGVAIEMAKGQQKVEAQTMDSFDFLEENLSIQQIKSSSGFTQEEKDTLIKALEILKEKKDMIEKIELNQRN